MTLTGNKIKSDWLGLWILLGFESLLFVGLLAVYIHIHLFTEVLWPVTAVSLVLPLAIFNALVLIISLAMLGQAWLALKAGRIKSYLTNLGLSLLAGALFLSMAAFDLYAHYEAGITPGRWLITDYYYAASGIMLLHLVIGWALLARQWSRKQDNATDAGFALHSLEISGVYWNYLALVWLIFFPLIILSRLP